MLTNKHLLLKNPVGPAMKCYIQMLQSMGLKQTHFPHHTQFFIPTTDTFDIRLVLEPLGVLSVVFRWVLLWLLF